MEIEFLNHASYALSYKNTTLLTDPYLKGKSFNNGWELIIPEVHYNFKDSHKKYIYFTHEHPDHFSTIFLNNIPKEERYDITILYQSTLDKKVKKYCEKIGYQFKELETGENLSLAENFSFMLGKVPYYDSWSYTICGERSILNVNDCIFEDPQRLNIIAKIVPKCNILFTQFSYANWIEGGRQEKSSRQSLSLRILNKIKKQCDKFKPEFIVPFASMVKFCHIENDYMNDSVNTPESAVRFIIKKTQSTPYLLIPNEKWDGLTKKDNTKSIEFWNKSYRTALKRPINSKIKTYSIAELEDSYDKMIKRVKRKNNWQLIYFLEKIGLYPKLIFLCSDIATYLSFSWTEGLKKSNCCLADSIEISTESLKFVFDYDYGIDTLNVNARFKSTLKIKRKMIRCFSILALNNIGIYIKPISSIRILMKISFIKQGLKAAGMTS